MIKNTFKFLKSLDYRIKFLIVGGLNSIVSVGIYLCVLLLFGVNIFNYNPDAYFIAIIVATATSQILSVIHSFFWNKFFTFESKNKSKAEIIRFFIVYAVAFAVEYFLKFYLRDISRLNEIAIAVIVLIIIMIISFIGQKWFVFHHKKSI
jgi:putative flippase GtrA